MMITAPGDYRVRNGLLIRVTKIADRDYLPVVGKVIYPDEEQFPQADLWRIDGRNYPDGSKDDPLDIVSEA